MGQRIVRSLAMFGAAGPVSGSAASFPRVLVDGTSVPVSMLNGLPPQFAGNSPAHAESALVQVQAFSCNYRDRTLAQLLHAVSPTRHFIIGSEFAGTVMAVGRAVTTLRDGDTVLTNHHYGPAHARGSRHEGVVTNHASREWQIVPVSALLRRPPAMDAVIGAAFSLNAQTAYSMIRKAELRADATVLVMAGSSNTSIFLVAALARCGAAVHVATTSAMAADRLRALGAAAVVVLPSGDARRSAAALLREHAATHGGFDAMFDPFFDLHVGLAPDLLRDFGTYLTCGMAGQNAGSAAVVEPLARATLEQTLYKCIVKNVRLVGNCIGLTADLQAALTDFEQAGLPVVVDSVFDDQRPEAFVARSLGAGTGRFGKVVLSYATRASQVERVVQ